MTKLTINVHTLNVFSGENKQGTDVFSSSLLGALAAKFIQEQVDGDTSCGESSDATRCTSNDDELVDKLAEEATQNSPVPYVPKVMLAERDNNASGGFSLDGSRKLGEAVELSTVTDSAYVVVQSSSSLGTALKASGGILTVGFVNKYNSSGNFGRTVHATMQKAEQYADGDCLAVEVFVARAADLRSALN